MAEWSKAAVLKEAETASGRCGRVQLAALDEIKTVLQSAGQARTDGEIAVALEAVGARHPGNPCAFTICARRS